jgi:hypothetical protein
MLVLYDVKSGKELWKQTFPASSRLLQSEDPSLTGMVEPDGRVEVFDLRSRKQVLDARIADKARLEKVNTVHLLADGRYFYVACNEPLEAGGPGAGFGAVQPVLMSGTGLRGLQVNGEVYCFKPDGKENWHNLARNQYLVLDQFADMPVVLFAARYQRWGGGARTTINQSSTVMAWEKLTGKLKYHKEDVPNGTNFHSLHVDTRAGRVDFIGTALKISFALEGDPVAAPEPKAGGGASLRPPADATRDLAVDRLRFQSPVRAGVP